MSRIRSIQSLHMIRSKKITAFQPSVRPFFGISSNSNSNHHNNNNSYNSDKNKHENDMSRRHYERKLIHLPREHLYDIIADVNNYKQFVPWCIDSIITKQSSEHQMIADLTVGFDIFHETYTSEIIMKRPDYVIASSKDSNLFQFLKTSWKFLPANNKNSTWVSFQVDFMFKSSLYNEISQLFLKEVTTKMVKAFEKRCNELAKQKKYK